MVIISNLEFNGYDLRQLFSRWKYMCKLYTSQTFCIVACKPTAEQRPRNKQLYDNKY
jgi:hypothetical protein